MERTIDNEIGRGLPAAGYRAFKSGLFTTDA
jgi:hypothetical protein